MKTTADLLKQLQALDVRIWVEDDRLRLDAPKGALTPELREELTAQKAEILAYLNTIQSADRMPALARMGGQGLQPLSSAQKRMWLLQQLDQGTSEYNLPQAVRLRGELNTAALQAGLNAIVRRHDVLRTTYTTVAGVPYQEVDAERPLSLQVIDLSASASREEEAQKLIRAEAHAPFDLEKEWPIRVRLLRLAADDHILLITMHHIASDGSSLAIFGQELALLYENYEASAPVADVLPTLPIQYIDYAVWEEKLLQSDYLTRQLAYWKQQLAGRLPELDLPTDFNRQPVRTFHGEQLERQLTAVFSQNLRHFCQVEGVTLYMALLAAFQLLLHRYSGQDEILVGSPIANRSQPELENMIGPFLNTLVLRTDLSGEPSFRDLLKRVREVSVGAFSNPDVPFEMILEELKAVRDASRTPLFEAFFNVLNFSRRTGGFSSLDTEFLLKPELDSYFDLALYVGGTDQQIELYLSYNADLFTAERMEAFLDHFTRLLAQVVENPQQQLWEFSLLTESERQKLLVGWNETAVSLESVSLPQLVERQAAKTLEATAVTFTGSQLTYRELNQRANQLAHYLRQVQGIQPGTLVAIGLERSLEMVVGILGVLKAGGAYVPLDPSYPAARIRYILQDTTVPVILTQATLAAQFANEGVSVVCLDKDWPEIAKQPQENMPQTVSPDHLAYVIHTSGSTGKPKGVQISHRNVVNFLLSMQQTPGLEAADVLLAVTTLSFDISVLELFLPLISGAQIVLADRDTSIDGVQLAKLMAETGVNVMQATPATWKMLLASGWEGNPRLKLLCGGEALPRELAKQLLPRVASVWNMYGPTETTVWSTVYKVTAVTNQIPIGRPIANTQIYILDKHMQPEPMGVFGELYIGGYGVSRGYLNRPDLTSERFVPNPFSKIPGDLLYKTGDAVRYSPDGSIAFIGRIDFQVKIRGFRIELEEIEVALNQHPAVKQSVVIVHQDSGDDSDDKRLIAYYIPAGDTKPDTNELRRHLQESLPAYMIPAVFIPLEAFPLTPNRKIDRQGLPKPEQDRFYAEDRFVPPTTQTELALAEIWRDMLRVRQVGITDNFFELGGHSLIATQIWTRINQVFGIQLALRQLFETPTVGELAQVVDAARLGQGLVKLDVQIVPQPRTGPLPLSFSQERMWFVQQMQPDSGAYNVAIGAHLKGNLNTAALEQAFNDVVQRHEVLRTRYETVNGQPVSVIEATAVLPLLVYDLQGTALPMQEAEMVQAVSEFAKRPFDLEHDPIIRIALFRLAPQEHIFLIVVHHIATDAWSSFMLTREITSLYQAYNQGTPPVLPPMPVQYLDFAIWQKQYFQGTVLEEQLNYWRNKLQDVSALELPTDRPRPAVQLYNGDQIEHQLTPTLLQQLHRLSQNQRVTTFMTILAAFQVLLYRYTRQTNFAIGVPIANRRLASSENLIGTFVNMLVLRADIEADLTFLELLQRVRQTSLEAYAHQDMPFEKLVVDLQLERDLSRSPLFQVMLDYINIPELTIQMDGLTDVNLPINRQTSQFDLGLIMVDTAQTQSISLEYNTDLFDAATAERLLNHLETLLTAIVAHPDTPISQLPLLLPAERQQLLETWNDTTFAYPQDACLHNLFEAQATRTPQKTAVIYEDQTITYAELNRRADDLAQHLQQLGVGPDVIVGLCLTRSVEMVVSLLAVLKAGGAYLPLDPAYPLDRLTYMLADAGSPVLISETSLNLAEKLAAELPQPIHVHMIDVDPQYQEQEAKPAPVANSVSPNHLAYVLYTSGSTGQPKGVEIPHRAVVNFLLSMQQKPGLTAVDNLLSVTTLSFDIAVLELYLPLITGASVTIVPRAVAYDGRLLAQKLQESGATIMQATPVTWRMLLDTGWRGDPNLKILCGGEAMPPDLARELLSRCHELWNMYGPTETTVWSTMRRILPDTNPITIGRPISNTQLFILDSYLQPVPIGIVGDLYIGGAGLARGYHNRPELTAEKFIKHPFQPNDRLYSTGDLARYLPNGEIDFLGRSDFQIKIRGFRVELGEIEAALMAHPAVREAVTIVREDIPGDKRLVAYLILAETAPHPSLADLREFVAEQLPAYMVPANFVILESFPKTPNRKVDPKALPAPDIAREDYGRQYAAPRNPVEEVAAQIMAETLNLDRVGIWDNFFELGGHSLLVTRVLFRITEQFRIELPLRGFFENPTAAGVAALMVADSTQRSRIERTAQLLINLSQLSDEEVAAMLRSKEGTQS